MATIETSREGDTLVMKTPAGTIRVNPKLWTPVNQEAAMFHGATQKIADGAAMSRNKDTGKPATAAEKFERMRAIAERIEGGGAWNSVGGGSAGGDLFRAMREAFPDSAHTADAKTFNEHLDTLAEKAKVNVAAIRTKLSAHATVKPILDRYAEERTAGIDETELLAGFSE